MDERKSTINCLLNEVDEELELLKNKFGNKEEIDVAHDSVDEVRDIVKGL